MTLARIGDADGGRSWVALMAPAVELAKAIAGTQFVPAALRNNPAAIAAAILYGDELGIGPMQALAKISVIDGRPFVAAEVQRGLVYAAGHELWLEESSNAKATWAGRRRGSDPVTRVTWTMDDARRAHLDRKPNWSGYPRAMLSARASAELVRAAFADVIGGLGAIEELEDFAPELVGLPAAPAPSAEPGTRRRARARPGGMAATQPAPAPAPEPGPPLHSATAQALARAERRPPISTPDEWRAAAPGPRRPPVPGEALGPEAEPAPAMMTAAQRARMMRLFRARGIGDRAERLRLSAEWVGRPLGSARELTSAEADRIVTVLELMPAPADVEALPELVPDAGPEPAPAPDPSATGPDPELEAPAELVTDTADPTREAPA